MLGKIIKLRSVRMCDSEDVRLVDETLCNVAGFSGEQTILLTVDLVFRIGSYVMPLAHKFAVVDESIFPRFFLLILDFLLTHKMDIDLKYNCCKKKGEKIVDLISEDNVITEKSPVLLLKVERECSEQSWHQIIISKVHNNLRFELKG